MSTNLSVFSLRAHPSGKIKFTAKSNESIFFIASIKRPMNITLQVQSRSRIDLKKIIIIQRRTFPHPAKYEQKHVGSDSAEKNHRLCSENPCEDRPPSIRFYCPRLSPSLSTRHHPSPYVSLLISTIKYTSFSLEFVFSSPSLCM